MESFQVCSLSLSLPLSLSLKPALAREIMQGTVSQTVNKWNQMRHGPVDYYYYYCFFLDLICADTHTLIAVYMCLCVCVLPACLGHNIRNIVSFLSLCFSPIEFGQHFCLHFVSIATHFCDFHCVSHCQACFVAFWVFPLFINLSNSFLIVMQGCPTDHIIIYIVC